MCPIGERPRSRAAGTRLGRFLLLRVLERLLWMVLFCLAQLWGQICTTLFQHSSSIRRALHQFDPDLTGKVDSEDFRSALVTLNTVLARTE